MTEKTVSGTVYADGVALGSISGTYIDDYQNSASEQILSRSVPITVADESGIEIGSGALSYDDYVSYNGGGVRTITVSGNVYANSDVVGSVSGSLDDQYGAVSAKIPTKITLTIIPS